MTFHDWIFSVYPADSVINGRWGLFHIATLAVCILIIAALTYFHSKNVAVRKNVIFVLAMLVLFLELTRRVINLLRGNAETVNDYLYLLLPRPWCAISCWLLIASVFIKKQFLYNFTAANALLCALIFFAYPSVGFNHKYILFENWYSITTHSLLFISSISMMTLGITDFKVEKSPIIKQAALLAGVFAYAFAEIYLLKIEKDPLYFMPENEVQAFLGVSYPLFLVIYVGFLALYFCLFYIVQHLLDKRRAK